MTTKSIKLSEDTYRRLVEIAGKLQVEYKKPVSIEDARRHKVPHKEEDKRPGGSMGCK
jgi:predicted transcriptional regulator